ncbi:AraC family transcriptional regulator [Niastella yeongjuensis]|uniref:AraC family transcriptional regulator n=1 Tax=Niastella yeongjuensis TaxID=354355 RepID=A0A1V9EMT6_9BACT|nr:helix-turn-helix domain-containing protein [Niastella yeongjuensis]OQP47473.1 AraC family transcriptional regulator [Niastella yeongjuensis]SEN85917.1 Transcriptional regulator GlxA family, contains an amidase domain and an AraC-type DNA-binding HTH domain [Niastella yeongjuensis]
MKHISILVLEDATMSCIDSSYQILTRINDFLKYQGKEPFYTVEMAGLKTDSVLNNGLYSIHTNKTIADISHTDVVVIPLLCGDFSKTLLKNKPYCNWLISQYQNGAEIVSLCVGSFFLASTGLLAGKKCAIHWAAKNEFMTMFPDIQVIDDSIITDENRIYTCGGGYSYLNLLLYVIEKHLGREMSVLASKMFEIDIERKNQHPFIIFVGQKKHGDQYVLQAQEYIERNPAALYTIDELCTKLAVGKRTFERKFKKCTGNSIAEYIQRVKVEYAKKQLESSDKHINEIIYEVGYNDVDAFRKVFKKHTDLSPVDYKKKFRV